MRYGRRRYARSPENGIATFYREPEEEDYPNWVIRVRYVIYPATDGGRDEPSTGVGVDIEWPDNLGESVQEALDMVDRIIEEHEWHEGPDE